MNNRPRNPVSEAMERLPSLDPNRTNASERSGPSRAEAEAAVRTLIAWAGDDPYREGLVETPARVTRAYREFFSGYQQSAMQILERTFKETEGYDEMITLRDIILQSHCEHHMVPFQGKCHLAYLPDKRIVGISKLARLVEVYARRLQIQEKLTVQIADAIGTVLEPKGVAVIIEAEHHCMTARGVCKPGTVTVTSHMTGAFRKNPATRREFLAMIRGS